jgi:small subunit ribosomal protein S2
MPRKKKTETEETDKSEEKKAAKPKKEKVEEEEKKVKKVSKKELEAKAKALAEKMGQEGEKVDLKEKLVEKKSTLIPVEDYIKYGVCMGTKVIIPHMKQFVYKRRADGIAVINTNIIDDKIKEMIKELEKYDPKDFVLICKREAGWKAAETFGKLFGIKTFTKKYPAGIITNTALPNFFEPEMVFICDPWTDKNALKDAVSTKKRVLGLCDTNNYTFGIDKFVPCNNKANKSIGLVLYLLAREYAKAKGIEKELNLEDFM